MFPFFLCLWFSHETGSSSVQSLKWLINRERTGMLWFSVGLSLSLNRSQICLSRVLNMKVYFDGEILYLWDMPNRNIYKRASCDMYKNVYQGFICSSQNNPCCLIEGGLKNWHFYTRTLHSSWKGGTTTPCNTSAHLPETMVRERSQTQ